MAAKVKRSVRIDEVKRVQIMGTKTSEINEVKAEILKNVHENSKLSGYTLVAGKDGLRIVTRTLIFFAFTILFVLRAAFCDRIQFSGIRYLFSIDLDSYMVKMNHAMNILRLLV